MERKLPEPTCEPEGAPEGRTNLEPQQNNLHPSKHLLLLHPTLPAPCIAHGSPFIAPTNTPSLFGVFPSLLLAAFHLSLVLCPGLAWPGPRVLHTYLPYIHTYIPHWIRILDNQPPKFSTQWQAYLLRCMIIRLAPCRESTVLSSPVLCSKQEAGLLLLCPATSTPQPSSSPPSSSVYTPACFPLISPLFPGSPPAGL